jgi:hypothetical protein
MNDRDRRYLYDVSTAGQSKLLHSAVCIGSKSDACYDRKTIAHNSTTRSD